MNKDKSILIIVFFLFLLFGVLLRFGYAGSFTNDDPVYTNKHGTYISSNPDGLYWLNDVSNIGNAETWAKFNPLKNQYFSFIMFLSSIFLGLIILNKGGISWKMSIIFLFMMLFSKFLYTRGAIGYYDHDYLGLAVFMLLILVYYLGMPFLILSPIILYGLNYVWNGLVPVAYLFVIILFIEYIIRKKDLIYHILKYFIYLILVWFVVKDTFDPLLYITETIFRLPLLIIMLPFVVVGLYYAIKKKEWFWQSALIFSSICLLHSNRMVIIAYPIIFLAFCSVLKGEKNIKKIIMPLILLFIITQVGGYLQLDRFGTDLTDEGLYYLHDNTKPNDKILSWWDYGYYIEYVAERNSIYGGSAKAKGLDQLSIFYCNGTLPSYDFDYFVNFKHQPNIIPAILTFKGRTCKNFNNPHINQMNNDKRFRLIFSNDDIDIYKKR